MEQNRRIKKITQNEKGQFAIEAVLLMLVLIGCFSLVIKQLKEKEVIQNLTDQSVGKAKNMASYGTWQDTCKGMKGGSSQTASNCHPNSINRALSSDPQ